MISLQPRFDLCATEALPADLRAYQQQLMSAAQEMLVGCNDTVWQVAAPTSCSILCATGESANPKLFRNAWQHASICIQGSLGMPWLPVMYIAKITQLMSQ